MQIVFVYFGREKNIHKQCPCYSGQSAEYNVLRGHIMEKWVWPHMDLA